MTRRGLILNSQQHLYPHGGLGWIRQTIAAVQWLKSENYRLIVATGAPTWELLQFLAQKHALPIEMYASDETDSVVELHQKMIRDADKIFPISIRPRGKLATFLISPVGLEKVDDRFSVRYEKETTRSHAYQFSDFPPPLPFNPNHYLFHWTRAARNGWSDISRAAFFQRILESSSFPFCALSTLTRILETRRLIASSRHMRRNCSVVSLTGLTPSEMTSRMRWRRRYREMSFEPYGIGVLTSWAEARGIREVQYVDGQNAQSMKNIEVWLLQGSG